jgi:intein/homing endonuclease
LFLVAKRPKIKWRVHWSKTSFPLLRNKKYIIRFYRKYRGKRKCENLDSSGIYSRREKKRKKNIISRIYPVFIYIHNGTASTVK